jgi:uncharacterized protein GlcG (DUF336 family)
MNINGYIAVQEIHVMTKTFPAMITLAAIVSATTANAPADAQVARSGYSLPLNLAMEAAAEAVRTCEASGYNVTATVVDSSGVVKLLAKGDHSTIHTKASSFRKAYTVVTMGPIFKFDATSRFDEIVAALGVGGAPGGDKDEACAEAGVAKIRERVTSASLGSTAKSAGN